MNQLAIFDWGVCVAYFITVVALSLASVRGQSDNEDYFLGGRRTNWMAVGVSMFATSFSSISFLGLPQRAAFSDFSFYLTILLILLLVTATFGCHEPLLEPDDLMRHYRSAEPAAVAANSTNGKH